VELGCDFACIRSELKANHIIYTAPIDSYFDYQFGKLPYRSLKFEPAHFSKTEQYQPVAVVNYPNEQAFTRITEFKHLTGQRCSGTSIAREYPRRDGDPFYPIPTSENRARYLRYRSMADKLRSITFIGRLAEYKYYNMDEVVAAAIAHATRIIAE
jgi:UDP-galactopyranose mutase